MSEDDHVAPNLPKADRTTAPQSPYSNRQIAVGILVLVVGVAVTFGLGLVLA